MKTMLGFLLLAVTLAPAVAQMGTGSPMDYVFPMMALQGYENPGLTMLLMSQQNPASMSQLLPWMLMGGGDSAKKLFLTSQLMQGMAGTMGGPPPVA